MARVAFSGTAITHRDRLPSSSRYELLVKIASGGMATVYVGRLSSVVGTSRLVAIKRAHAHLLEDPMFSKMLIAEAKLASRIHHPNVVAVQNVEEVDGELLLVMDYVEGASLADLASDDEIPVPGRVAVRALLDACAGLHAAHELTDDDGKPLGIVHRDVSGEETHAPRIARALESALASEPVASLGETDLELGRTRPSRPSLASLTIHTPVGMVLPSRPGPVSATLAPARRPSTLAALCMPACIAISAAGMALFTSGAGAFAGEPMIGAAPNVVMHDARPLDASVRGKQASPRPRVRQAARRGAIADKKSDSPS